MPAPADQERPLARGDQRGRRHRRGEHVVARIDAVGAAASASTSARVGNELLVTKASGSPAARSRADGVGGAGDRLVGQPHHAVEIEHPGHRADILSRPGR